MKNSPYFFLGVFCSRGAKIKWKKITEESLESLISVLLIIICSMKDENTNIDILSSGKSNSGRSFTLIIRELF